MKPLSFQVRRDAAGSLTEQIVQGFQAAVNTGHLAPGDRLPTLLAMSAELGVCMITMRRAITRLAAVGVLEVQRGTGVHVGSTHKSRFQAHVLFVSTGPPASFYYATRNHAFLKVLREHDVLATTVYVGGQEANPDFPTVRHLLDTQPVALVVLEGDWMRQDNTLQRLLVEQGIHFVQTWTDQPSPAAVDSVYLDPEPAERQLARHCAWCKPREVIVLSGGEGGWRRFAAAAKALDLIVSREALGLPPDNLTGEDFERDGYLTVTRLIKLGRIERGCVMLVSTDDYVSRGVMTALLEAGWRFPRDIQFATLVNHDHAPVAWAPLTRIEMYPVRDGETMAQLVLRNLSPTVRRRKPLVVRPRFVAGKSTRRRRVL